MSLFSYLQLQPIDPQDDGSVSELDQFDQDEAFDLAEEVNGEQLVQEWDEIEKSMHAADSGTQDSV